eukprot:CAMPEP_0119493064 /NCGR_PEP_ID=MMETSP1344-20130328/17423_1 /TAXON_ID=236787 /ORGANISM="Florenciella parvula, Strain CCMP2471" /LENGTH=74 /DNA_ID=CAMNT_0007528453 /DNA_START=122 /DNA_END=346 /DNA_ORIENTATION=+
MHTPGPHVPMQPVHSMQPLVSADSSTSRSRAAPSSRHMPSLQTRIEVGRFGPVSSAWDDASDTPQARRDHGGRV